MQVERDEGEREGTRVTRELGVSPQRQIRSKSSTGEIAISSGKMREWKRHRGWACNFEGERARNWDTGTQLVDD